MTMYRIKYYKSSYGYDADILIKEFCEEFENYSKAMKWAIDNIPNDLNGIDVQKIK